MNYEQERSKQLRDALTVFRKVLCCASQDVDAFGESVQHGSYRLDWLQANWETIVEGAVTYREAFDMRPIYLEVYGEGADYYGKSSRILKPNALPTHRVCCRPQQRRFFYDEISEQEIQYSSGGLPLEEFVSITDHWYQHSPPFDCVLLTTPDEDIVVKIDTIEFFLQAIA